MIDFGLSEDQEALQRSAREVLGKECQPALVRETARTADGIPTALYTKMAELGWMGLVVPEAYGGLGLGTLELALVLEELGRVVAPGPFLGTQLVTSAIVRGGTAAAKKTWLPRLVAGEAWREMMAALRVRQREMTVAEAERRFDEEQAPFGPGNRLLRRRSRPQALPARGAQGGWSARRAARLVAMAEISRTECSSAIDRAARSVAS